MPLDVMLLDPLPDKDAPSMIKQAKEEIWRVRDAVADQQKRNFTKVQKQYTNPPEDVRVGDVVLYLDKWLGWSMPISWSSRSLDVMLLSWYTSPTLGR